jgi:hypothetical protein
VAGNPFAKPGQRGSSRIVEELDAAPVSTHPAGEADLSDGLGGQVDRRSAGGGEVAVDPRCREDDALRACVGVLAMEDDPERQSRSSADRIREITAADDDLDDLAAVGVDLRPNSLGVHHSLAPPTNRRTADAVATDDPRIERPESMLLLQPIDLSAR